MSGSGCYGLKFVQNETFMEVLMLKSAKKMASEWKKEENCWYRRPNVYLMGFASDTSDPSRNFRYVPFDLMQC